MAASSPMDSLKSWVLANYSEPLDAIRQTVRVAYVVFSFCSAFFLGGLKALVVGPIASAVLIIGNIGVIIVLFPAHVAWTVYSIIKTNRINAALKLALLFALPVLFGLWLGLSVFGSVLVGVGYGVFTPWISTFEAFREETETKKFLHSIVDGTWGTIKGSCTVVRDFADICYHSYPVFLKELREASYDHQPHSIRLRDVPSCVLVGLMGLVVDIPLITVIALIKSPYMLYKGWQRLLHDLISREGIFLETLCVPIAGLAILCWPLIVLGSVLLAIVSSIFVGLYGAVIVYQERSFRRGAAYVIAMVAEFDEYTNDWLYLREGTVLPKPGYRKRKQTNSMELSVKKEFSTKGSVESTSGSSEAPGFHVPKLAPSRSVREAIQEVKMVQIWENIMKMCNAQGKELLDANIITSLDLTDWLFPKSNSNSNPNPNNQNPNPNQDTVGLGLPSFCLLQSILHSIKSGSSGLLLSTGFEINHLNRPQDRLLDWFFHPVMVLKEQIRVLKLREEEVRFLEKSVLFVANVPRASAWDNGSRVPQDALRAAQIQAISRRLVGITRSVSKLPTYRRRYRQLVRLLLNYTIEKEGSIPSHSNRSNSSIEIVPAEV